MIPALNTKIVFLCLGLSFLFASYSQACPKIGGLIDYNCDRKLKFVFTGDSVVFGHGDDDHEGGGGYVARVAEHFSVANVQNIGVKGITTRVLLRSFMKNLPKVPPGTTRRKSKMADIFFIDVGRNDYFDRVKPAVTVRNIRRIVSYLRKELTALDGKEPIVVVSTLVPSTRKFQKNFISEVNRILIKYKSKALPTLLRVEKMETTLLSVDGLHPSSLGYDAIAESVIAFINGRAQKFARNH